jgi:hypothetical protein
VRSLFVRILISIRQGIPDIYAGQQDEHQQQTRPDEIHVVPFQPQSLRNRLKPASCCFRHGLPSFNLSVFKTPDV